MSVIRTHWVCPYYPKIIISKEQIFRYLLFIINIYVPPKRMGDCKLYTCCQGEYWNVIFWYTLIMVVNLLLVLVVQGCRNWVPISNFSVFAFLPHLGNCFILGFFISKRIGLMGICLLCQIPWNLYMLPEWLFFYPGKSWYGKRLKSLNANNSCNFCQLGIFCQC